MPSEPVQPRAPLRVVVMGVSGSGKSTVGELLADELGVEFADADDFHTPANVAKMASGTPLTDADRWPWLEAVGSWLEDHADAGAVVACSALRRAYRDALRAHAPDLWFLYCSGAADVLERRLGTRPRHFMPASLLASQLDSLEPPGGDERAVSENVSQQPRDMVADFLAVASTRP